MPRTIKFLGGVALLVSGLTGPSIGVIPQLFQQAGWLTPLTAFVLVTILAGSAALFLVESMATITGNEDFQASIEYSTLAELFLGHRWHWALQILLYVALQSQAITSLIESFQAMDTLLVTVAHKSCAISFQKGWECVTTVPTNGQGVFSDYILISFGYLITFILVLPLGLIHLSDNIRFQIASFITLFIITIIWVVTFFQVGINNYPIPVVGSDQGTVVGYVISNFAFVTTIPAFVNNIHPSTNIYRVIWLSLLISCAIYLVIGFTGASAFRIPQNSTILSVISDRRPSVIALISVYAFPIAVLITSIPVFMIVIRYNLLRGNICSKPWAIFWSSILPWIVVIPFQTNGWLTIIMNWTSLVFSSSANLVVPFVLYLMSRRYHASAALDLHQEHDEFHLRPLEISNVGTPPLSNQPRSPSSHVRYSRTSEDFEEKLVPPDDAEVLSVASGEDHVIRVVRSPSIHRHYGETAAEGSGLGRDHGGGILRKLSISKAAAVPGERTEEKSGSSKQPVSSPTSLAVPLDELLNLPESNVMRRRRSSYASTAETKPGPSPTDTHMTHLSVPEIRIDTAAASSTIGHRSSREYNLSASSDTPQKQSTLSSPSRSPGGGSRRSVERRIPSPVSLSPSSGEGMDIHIRLPSLAPAVDPENGGVGEPPRLDSIAIVISPSSAPSITTPDDATATSHPTPHRTFEAFPKLNKLRWFDSAKVAIVFCAITSTMVAATIVYDIVLASRGNSQG